MVFLYTYEKQISVTVRDIISAMGKANHTLLRTPVFERRYAAGRSTIIWRQKEVIIEK